MLFPTLTAAYAAVLALIYIGLSGWVVAGRAKFRVNHGDGGNPMLLRRIRAHANFSEYVPLGLILIGLLEAGGAGHGIVLGLLLVLVVSRLAHPIGMVAAEMSTQQVICRGVGTVATFSVMIVAAVLLLIRVL